MQKTEYTKTKPFKEDASVNYPVYSSMPNEERKTAKYYVTLFQQCLRKVIV